MQSIADLIKARKQNKDYRNSYEHQAYGNRLAEEFNDTKHRALYIKLAKTKNRNILESAREFVLSQEHIKDKGRIFMWKLKQIENRILDEVSKKT